MEIDNELEIHISNQVSPQIQGWAAVEIDNSAAFKYTAHRAKQNWNLQFMYVILLAACVDLVTTCYARPHIYECFKIKQTKLGLCILNPPICGL